MRQIARDQFSVNANFLHYNFKQILSPRPSSVFILIACNDPFNTLSLKVTFRVPAELPLPIARPFEYPIVIFLTIIFSDALP